MQTTKEQHVADEKTQQPTPGDVIGGLKPYTAGDGPREDIENLFGHLATQMMEGQTPIPESTPPGARAGLARHITLARMAAGQIFGTIEGTVVTCVRAGLMTKEEALAIQTEALAIMGLKINATAEVANAPMVAEAPAPGPESGTSAG